MIKIGDFSRISRVSVRMLRHYDQLGLFKPAYVDDKTGYRSYDIKQLPVIHRIVALKDMGFNTKEIQSMINRDISVDEIKEMLFKRKQDLQNDIAMAEIHLKSVENRLNQIDLYGTEPQYDVTIKDMPAISIVSIREVIPEIRDMSIYCYDMHKHVYDYLSEHKIAHNHEEVTMYHNNTYTTTDLDVEIGVAVRAEDVPTDLLDELEKYKSISPYVMSFRAIEPKDKVASLIYEGPINVMEAAVNELLNWIGRNDYSIAGPAYEYHLSGPVHNGKSTVPSVIIEFMIPITENK